MPSSETSLCNSNGINHFAKSDRPLNRLENRPDLPKQIEQQQTPNHLQSSHSKDESKCVSRSKFGADQMMISNAYDGRNQYKDQHSHAKGLDGHKMHCIGKTGVVESHHIVDCKAAKQNSRSHCIVLEDLWIKC